MAARTQRAIAAVAMIAAAALPGCGGDEEVELSPLPAERSGTAPAAGGTVAGDPLRELSAGVGRLTITVRDGGPDRFRYRAPRTVRGGLVEIRLRNAGRAMRKAQLWRIAGEHSVAEALRARRPLPDWLRAAGGVALTAPGATGRSLQALPAGRYYVAGTGGERGTVASFTVTGPSSSPGPPPAPARVEMRDFSFRASGLRAGRNSVDLDNTGGEPHHAFFVPIRPGADLGDVRRFFGRRSSTGPPPVDSDGTRDSVVLEGGERQVTQLDLPAARYAVICFVRNRGGGPPHLELGMINELTVR